MAVDPRHKWTAFWNAGPGGFSEEYITPQATYDTLAGHLQGVLGLRSLLLYDNAVFLGVRVSEYADPTVPSAGVRRSRLMIPPSDIYPGTTTRINLPAQGNFGHPSSSLRPDQIRVALQMRATFDSNRNSTKYLDGVPDQVTGFDPASYVPTGDPAWATSLANYTGALIRNSFSVAALDKSDANKAVRIINLQSQGGAPGDLGVVYTNVSGFAPSVGDKIHVRDVRVKPFTFQPPLNGVWVVDSVTVGTGGNPSVVYLRGSGTYDPNGYKVSPFSNIQLEKKSFYAIKALDPVRVGVHKRGKPGPYFRGRQKRRLSVDP